jgi:CRISPR/Cas system-associated endonuclease/helicase Cas3
MLKTTEEALLEFAIEMVIRDMKYNTDKEWSHAEKSRGWREQGERTGYSYNPAFFRNADKEMRLAQDYRRSHMRVCSAFLKAIAETEAVVRHDGEDYRITSDGCELVEE